MSKTKHTESFRESGELTDDKLAAVVGGRVVDNLRAAREDFRDGNYASGYAHLAAGMANQKNWI